MNTTQQQTTTQSTTETALAQAAIDALLKKGQQVIASKRATGADVVRVAEWGTNGPTRLVLRCKTASGDGCGREHERAVQDAHQAHLCPDCRAKADKAKKRAKRPTKREAAKATIAELNRRLQEAEAKLAAAAKQG